MVETISASSLTLHEIKQKFNLQQSDRPDFFPEWQAPLPELTVEEKGWLDRVKADFLSLAEYPLHEKIVKMAVLSPLLFFAGFFRYPFYPRAEVEVEIAAEDNEEVVKGKIDVLILQEQIWVTVIETKNKQFSLARAIPQALFYMMSSPIVNRPIFGLVTNGSHFTFIKLLKQPIPQYALSDEFSLNRRGNELYDVLGLLKRLGELTQSAAA
ncbi:restriction endonuclease subunit R [Phormidium tenue FACHB-886]|nr:restriction endonuclease subunit R [Phormidium tenue FACHB-886]